MNKNNNVSYDKKIKNNIDNWHLSDIGVYADHLSELPSEHNVKNSGPIDKVIRQVAPEILPTLPTFSFEVGPWIALLALVEHKFPKSKPLTYGELIKKQEYITTLMDRNSSAFGYGGISNSLAAYTTKELLGGNSFIGKNTLGELINTLNQGSNSDQALASINTLNLMLNEFALINQFNNIDSVGNLSYAAKNMIDTTFTKKLSVQNNFPVSLLDEIQDFILQVYKGHPFNDDGISIYFRPAIAHAYTKNPTNSVFKKNVQTPPSEHPIQNNNDITRTKVLEIHEQFDSNKIKLATAFVRDTICNYNELFSKRKLLQSITPNDASTTALGEASLEDFIAFDSENASLLKSLDKNSQDNFEVKKLFVHLDQYLINLVLPHTSTSNQKQSYGATLPLNQIRYIIQKYDSTSATESFNSTDFIKNLRIALTSGTDEMISCLREYKDTINQSLETVSDEPDKNLAQFMEKLKALMKPLNNNQDFSKLWNDLINSNNA